MGKGDCGEVRSLEGVGGLKMPHSPTVVGYEGIFKKDGKNSMRIHLFAWVRLVRGVG